MRASKALALNAGAFLFLRNFAPAMLKLMKTLTILFLLFFGASHVNAQDNIIKIWPNGAPGAIADASYKEDTLILPDKSKRVSKVTDPTLTVYKSVNANGTAIIICPGGGYGRLSVDLEGYDIALWFNKLGITAFVLKYRLPSDLIMKDKSIGPLQDAQEAIRIVRRNAASWKINPDKIGILGFSAGGHLASTASTHFNNVVYQPAEPTSARPDFSILIYPVISMDSAITHKATKQNLLGKKPAAEQIKKYSNELQVNQTTPQTFLVHATDDRSVPAQNSINYYLALKKNNIPAEMHIYEKGGHGFGLGKTQGTESTWPEACKNWLKARGLL